MSALIIAIILLYAFGSVLLLICIWSGSGDPLPPPKANREAA